jgi:hypothetical protein
MRYGNLAALLLSSVVLAFVVGCSSEESSSTTVAPSGPSAEGRKFVLAAAPEGAQQVIAARADVAADAEVVVVGRIGGSTQPFVDGMAAFSIVDSSLKACSDIPGDTCPTPWDYCCEAGLPKARMLVKFVDDGGEVVTSDARTLLGVAELQTVYVRGKAQRDADGNLSLLASQIYVQPETAAPVPAASGEGHDDDHGHDHDHAHEDEPAATAPTGESEIESTDTPATEATPS